MAPDHMIYNFLKAIVMSLNSKIWKICKIVIGWDQLCCLQLLQNMCQLKWT